MAAQQQYRLIRHSRNNRLGRGGTKDKRRNRSVVLVRSTCGYPYDHRNLLAVRNDPGSFFSCQFFFSDDSDIERECCRPDGNLSRELRRHCEFW
jgi:hypothetical protein